MSSIQELRKLAGISPRLPNLQESRERCGVLTEAKLPTFMAKRTELLAHLKKEGWAVVDGLKVPHATSPDKQSRLWFKTQAVLMSHGVKHALGDARSMWSDIRTMTVEDFMKAVHRWSQVSYEPRESAETPAWSDAYPHVEEGDLAEADEAMTATDFKTALDGMLRSKVGDRHVRVKIDNSFGSTTVYVDFINLEKSVVPGPNFGAEGENNRILLDVDGFKGEQPAGKVKVEVRKSAIPREYKLRAKAAAPAKIAAYIADFLGKVVKEVKPNYTHTKPGA